MRSTQFLMVAKMNDIDLKRSITQYARHITKGITPKAVRNRVCEEYAEHIEDTVNRLMLDGVEPKAAFEQACRALGDISEFVPQLEQIHNLPALPPDIRKLRCTKFTKILIFCLGSFSGILSIILLFGQRLFGAIPTEGRIILEILICSIPFIIFRIPFKFFNRSFEGVITKIDVKTVYNTTDKLANKLEYWYYENINILTIKTTHGKTVTYKFKVSVDRYNPSARPVKDRFEVGDIVRHYAGFDELQLVHRPGLDITTCIVCGMQNHINNTICAQCGHTIIS